MSSIPSAKGIDSTLALLRNPYPPARSVMMLQSIIG